MAITKTHLCLPEYPKPQHRPRAVAKSEFGDFRRQEEGGLKRWTQQYEQRLHKFTDQAIYRPSDGTWHVRPSSGKPAFARACGTQGDIPLSGDMDSDGVRHLWGGVNFTVVGY